MPRRQKKYHYIYKTTCTVNGKYYIGMHSTDNLEDGYLGSGKRLWYSRKKHGDKNHVREILEYCSDRKELRKREEEIVNGELVDEELCMNLVVGGGGFMLDEHHYKCASAGGSATAKRLKEDPEFLKRRQEIGAESFRKAHADGKIKYDTFKGRKHSDESKNKISEAMKKVTAGEGNSQFGTCWITKDGVNKKIRKEELPKFIRDKWTKGRKMNRA